MLALSHRVGLRQSPYRALNALARFREGEPPGEPRRNPARTEPLNERLRRLWAATEAHEIGRGGVTTVALATGLSQTTISGGIQEQQSGAAEGEADRSQGRLRRPGGGRKPLAEHETRLLKDLEALVDPVTRGDSQSPLQ